MRAYQVLLNPAAVGTVVADEATAAPAGLALAGDRRVRGRRHRDHRRARRLALAVERTAVARRPGLPDRTSSIAVLPFENMSGSAEQEYFSDGISEDIITDLSKIAGLLVIARNSSFKFKGRSVDLRQVAGDLGVRYVLEGACADRVTSSGSVPS